MTEKIKTAREYLTELINKVQELTEHMEGCVFEIEQNHKITEETLGELNDIDKYLSELKEFALEIPAGSYLYRCDNCGCMTPENYHNDSLTILCSDCAKCFHGGANAKEFIKRHADRHVCETKVSF